MSFNSNNLHEYQANDLKQHFALMLKGKQVKKIEQINTVNLSINNSSHDNNYLRVFYFLFALLLKEFRRLIQTHYLYLK